jgi:hypothetical protein
MVFLSTEIQKSIKYVKLDNNLVDAPKAITNIDGIIASELKLFRSV